MNLASLNCFRIFFIPTTEIIPGLVPKKWNCLFDYLTDHVGFEPWNMGETHASLELCVRKFLIQTLVNNCGTCVEDQMGG